MARLKLKQLESYLESVDDFEDPKILLEQYATRPHIAACILYTMESQYGDLCGKTVADIGCGSGRLAIGCSMLGASYVLGLDIDTDALDICSTNITDFDISTIDLVNMDAISIPTCLYKKFDTVVMNPPFGTKHNHGLDMKFLDTGLNMATTAVYSLHKTSTRDHILKVCADRGIKAQVIAELKYDIPATYKHHKKRSVDIEVDFYRFEPLAHVL